MGCRLEETEELKSEMDAGTVALLPTPSLLAAADATFRGGGRGFLGTCSCSVVCVEGIIDATIAWARDCDSRAATAATAVAWNCCCSGDVAFVEDEKDSD